MKAHRDAKTRDPVARALRSPAFRKRQIEDQRRRIGRKAKHKTGE